MPRDPSQLGGRLELNQSVSTPAPAYRYDRVEWRLGHDDEQDSRQTFELKGERQHETKSEDCVVRIDDVGNNIHIRLFHICHF